MRIVYFDIADTILDTEVQTRLGMQSLFAEPWTLGGIARVKLEGEWVIVQCFLPLPWRLGRLRLQAVLL